MSRDGSQTDREPSKSHAPLLLMTAAAGAAAAYFLDPVHGARRRALVREGAAALRGAETTPSLTAAERSLDAQLAERVRAGLNSVVSHPRSVGVMARDGVIELIGSVLSEEREPLLTSVRSVAGVRKVVDQLQLRSEAANGSEALANMPRVLGGALGSALLALGLLKRRAAFPAALFGATMLARAVARPSASRR